MATDHVPSDEQKDEIARVWNFLYRRVLITGGRQHNERWDYPAIIIITPAYRLHGTAFVQWDVWLLEDADATIPKWSWLPSLTLHSYHIDEVI